MNLLKEIPSLYDAVTDIEAAIPFQTELALKLDATNVGIGVLFADGERAYVGNGVSTASQRAYIENFEKDPWAAAVLAMRRKETVVIGEELVDPKQYRTSQFYLDIMQPAGIEHLLAVAHTQDEFTSFLAINRSSLDKSFLASEKHQAKQLAKHIAAFGRIVWSDTANRSGAFLDLPVFHVSGRGRCSANEGAHRILDSKCGIRIDANRLSLPSSKDQAILDNLLLSLRAHQWGELAKTIQIQTLNGVAYLMVIPSIEIGVNFERRHSADIVLVKAPEYQIHDFAKRHGLSAAERRLVDSLLAGQTLKECAASSNRSVHTIRTHLKNVFSKVRCSSQAELIRIIFSDT